MTATERDRLVVLETKVDGINTKLDQVIKDHEDRIRALECKPSKRWEASVIALITGIIGAVIGAIFAVFVK